ncbi:hypothetical protein O181_000868 [Austropuccinia psidii MF-1]|uniref:Uncharacterized protein n=1 Tax=Austropuccinia psidii MF-1 TaxID=1389203 RepID=A0A9Q3GB82_9BASI|nr:hypothetical protein [Austropuccinia psidii MF-1]
MASLGNFDPHQIYDGYKEAEILDPPCSQCLMKAEEYFQHFNPRIRKIADSPTNPDAEGRDELDREEAEVIHPLVDHSSSSSPIQPPAKKLYSNLIPNTPRNFQPVLPLLPSSIPPPSPKPSTSRPFLTSPMKSSPIQQPRPSPIPTCDQHQPKKRSLVSFSIPRCSSISKLRDLANQGYQRGSKCGE